MNIHCNECKKFLFEVQGNLNPGAVGAEAQHKGFLYKNASLFSKEYSSLYFCNHECGRAFYKKNIPPDPEITKVIEDLKKNIPESAKAVAIKMNAIIEEINARRKKGTDK